MPSGRGSEEGCTPSPNLHARPTCASHLPGRSTAPSSAPGLGRADHRPLAMGRWPCSESSSGFCPGRDASWIARSNPALQVTPADPPGGLDRDAHTGSRLVRPLSICRAPAPESPSVPAAPHRLTTPRSACARFAKAVSAILDACSCLLLRTPRMPSGQARLHRGPPQLTSTLHGSYRRVTSVYINSVYLVPFLYRLRRCR